jgi:molybdate transport repressor ModE-like protein
MFFVKPHVKLYVSSNSTEGVFGEGKWSLLRAVENHGSIKKAASELRRSYRKAWGDIKKAEAALGQHLVIKKRGGSDGGGATITSYCKHLLNAWEVHRNTIDACVDESFNRNLKKFFKAASSGHCKVRNTSKTGRT